MPQGFSYGEIRIYHWLDIIPSTRKLNSLSFPWSQTIYWKKSLIPFTQIISTNYDVACVFSFTIKIYLKKLVGTKSFNTKQCLVRWSPTIIPTISLTFFPKMSPSFNIDFLFPCRLSPPSSQDFYEILHSINPSLLLREGKIFQTHIL